MTKKKNPWKTLKSKIVHDSPWIKVSSHDVIDPGGNAGKYSTVHFKNYAIGIIPLDEYYYTWIVGQYRYPVDEYTWEIPEGGGAIDTSPLKSAKRELLEETGIKAGKWQKILEMQLSNSATDELAIVYIARDLSFHPPQPEDDEELLIKKLPFHQLYLMALNGKIKDSLTVAGVLKTKLLINEGLI